MEIQSLGCGDQVRKVRVMDDVKLSISGGKVILDMRDGSALMVMNPTEARLAGAEFLKQSKQAQTVAMEIIEMADVAERTG